MIPDSELRSAFASLEELLAGDDERFVREAYRAFLGREADPEGFAGYLAQLAAGLPRVELLSFIALSREGLSRQALSPALRCALAQTQQHMRAQSSPEVESLDQMLALNDETLLRCAYHVVLAREPDADGFEGYLSMLRGGAAKLKLMESLRRSSESKACESLRDALRRAGGGQGSHATVDEVFGLSPADFLHRAYLLLAGRKISPQELALQTNRLAEGADRSRVLADLAESHAAADTRKVLQDLDRALDRRRWTRLPLLGRFIAARFGLERDTRDEMRLRRLENEVYRVSLAANGMGSIVIRAAEMQGSLAVATVRPVEEEVTEPDVVLRTKPSARSRLLSLPVANDGSNRRSAP